MPVISDVRQIFLVYDPNTLSYVPWDGAVTIDSGPGGGLTDDELRASAVPVSLASVPSHAVTNAGTFAVQATGTVTANAGTNLNTSALALDATLTGGTQKSKLVDTGGTNVASVSAAGALKVDNSGVTQPVSGTVTANAGTGTMAVSLATLPALVASTAAIGKLAANDGVDIGNVDVASITPPTLTKGTQGSTGFSVQNLKDAGRTELRFYAVAAAAGTTGTETAITLTKSSGTSATSTGTSFVITSGKRFRINAISYGTRGHATATIQTTTFNLRVNTAGAVGTTSTPIVLAVRSATPATASAWDRVYVDLIDGWEIVGDGTLQFGVTAAATYTTNAPTWDVMIVGYEY